MEEGIQVALDGRGSRRLLVGSLLLSLLLVGCAGAMPGGSPTGERQTTSPFPPSAITLPPEVPSESHTPPSIPASSITLEELTPSPTNTPGLSAAATTQRPPSAMTVAPSTYTSTPAPVPATTEAPPSRCAIQATRTPGPGAPTFGPHPGPATTPRYVDPHIEICASASAVKVGQLVTIMGYPVDVGLPYYALRQKDAGAETNTLLLEVTYDNQFKHLVEGTEPLEFVAVTAAPWWVEIVLRASRPGTAGYFISATGEIHYGYPGPATWGGGASETVVITVE